MPQQKPKKPIQSQRVRLKSLPEFVKRGWKVIVGVSTVVGLVGGLMFFASRVTVSSLSPLNPADPFSTPFAISNDGAFSIYDVKFSCYFKDVAFSGSSISRISVEEDVPSIKTIEAGEKATYKCLLSAPDASSGSRADIYVVASYQPKFLPYQVEKLSRFVMQLRLGQTMALASTAYR